MKVLIYTKSVGILDADLKDAPTFAPVIDATGGYLTGFITIGETEEGAIIVRRDELIAIVPGGLPQPA